MKHNPGFLKVVEGAKQRVRECTVSDVKARLDRGEQFHFVDVREDREYEQDHAAGAVHLGKGVIERDIETVIPNQQDAIVLYCGGGYRSALAADSIRQMGYTNMLSMDGGIKAWREARLPWRRAVVRSACRFLGENFSTMPVLAYSCSRPFCDRRATFLVTCCSIQKALWSLPSPHPRIRSNGMGNRSWRSYTAKIRAACFNGPSIYWAGSIG